MASYELASDGHMRDGLELRSLSLPEAKLVQGRAKRGGGGCPLWLKEGLLEVWTAFSDALCLGETAALLVDACVLLGLVSGGVGGGVGGVGGGVEVLGDSVSQLEAFEAALGVAGAGSGKSLFRTAGGRDKVGGFARTMQLRRPRHIFTDVVGSGVASAEYGDVGGGLGGMLRVLQSDSRFAGMAAAAGAIGAGGPPMSEGLEKVVQAAKRVFAGRLPGAPLEPDVVFPYGVADSIGARPYMEDRHVARAELCGNPALALYVVLDGHGGWRASEYCRRQLPLAVEEALGKGLGVPEALVSAFRSTDQHFIMEAHRRFPQWDDGTTVVAALVDAELGRLWTAHAGDSRAVLAHTDGKATPLTSDHKPDRPDEYVRIAEQGGRVERMTVARVNGILAVSRAIGDRVLKPAVTSVPDVAVHDIRKDDKFLVLASDGLFDVVTNDEVAHFAAHTEDACLLAERLVANALVRGSMDNITALAIDLRGAAVQPEPKSKPKPRDPAALKRSKHEA